MTKKSESNLEQETEMKDSEIMTGYDSLEFQKIEIEWLCKANNSNVSKTRAELRNAERRFIRKAILDDRKEYFGKSERIKVLSAGSGLGNELVELADYVNEVTGIEKNSLVCKIANNYLGDLGIFDRILYDKLSGNKITIVNGDFFNMPFENNSFEYSILNSGTIGNFADSKKIDLIKELMKITSRTAFISFYDPGEEATKKRLAMYEDEKIEGEPEVIYKSNRNNGSTSIITYKNIEMMSEAMSLDKFNNLVRKAGNAKVHYYQITDFSWLANIFPEK